MTSAAVRAHCDPAPEARSLLEHAMDRMGLSARAYTRVLKAARSIADLEGAERISKAHVLEALQYRNPFSSESAV
jgi:magnesium chelatase family protein